MDLTNGGSEQFLALLGSLRNCDNTIRDAAEKTYSEALKTQANSVLTALVSCLNTSVCSDDVVRTQAATLLRRAVVPCGPSDTPWSRADAAVQLRIRQSLFQALEAEPSQQVRRVLVAGISAVANQAPEEAPWTELVDSAFVLAGSANAAHRDAALRVLSELVGTSYTQAILAKRQELGALVSTGLGTPGLQAASLGLVAEMVTTLDAETSQALQPVLPMAEGALQALAASDPSAFEDALQSLISSASEKAAFFKPRYSEWVAMMLAFAGAKGTIEDGTRSLAFEWISSIAETKAKLLMKAVPDLPRRAMETAFSFLAEVEEDEQWQHVDEDEEEDDDDSLHKTGEAKVDFFVQKLGFDQTGPALMALLQQYGTSQHWEAKVAAAMAIRAAAEFVSDDQALDTMALLLLQLLRDGHMRVRYAAVFALGQMCHDQEAEFHSRLHSKLLPQLLQACNDPVDRVAAMAASAVEAIVSELDEGVLAECAKPILDTFVARLTSCSHKGVLVAIMEALGALAAGMEGSFEGYYEQLMPMLLAYVQKQDTQPAAAKLRGKAFECISLLGLAVGKEAFLPAAQQAMAAIMATPAVADDVQGDCIREAMERMCKILGADFAPFLPALLPSILAGMSLHNAVAETAGDEAVEGQDDEEDAVVLPTEDGFVKVKSGQIMEILAVVSLLNVFIKETGPAFFDFVRPTAEALAKILGCADSVLNVASSVRDAVYPCWADLVEAISKTVPMRGREAQDMVVELVQRFVDKVGADLVKAEDPDDLAPMANGIACVVKNAGAGCLQPAQVQGVCDLALSEVLKSFQRDEALKAANGPGQLKQAEKDEDEVSTASNLDVEEMEEQEARIGLTAIFGACMKANPEVFVSYSLPKLQPLMQQWFGPQGGHGRLLGLHIACDLCEHLHEQSVALWPLFMEASLEALRSQDAAERNAAAFILLLAAQAAAFGQQYATRAYVALGTSLQSFKVKKNDEDAQRAADNVVAALVQLCLSHPSACPDLDGCWQAAFAKMPLKVDTEEGRKLHRKLFLEAQKPGGGNLGSVARVAQVLGYLAEIYGRSEHCDEELQRDICKAFCSLPQATLESLKAQLSAKQRKKVERIQRDAQPSTA
mmetsp:Transcript_100706/g.324981  ORF Transcript_100706/g.324981 Transcript_100706/m.324981 type:complete len:1112 (-) Transcript_100706:196-3531(-)